MILVTLKCLTLLAFTTFSFSLIFFFAICFLCVSIKIVLCKPHSLFMIKSFLLSPMFFDQDAIFTSPTHITLNFSAPYCFFFPLEIALAHHSALDELDILPVPPVPWLCFSVWSTTAFKFFVLIVDILLISS